MRKAARDAGCDALVVSDPVDVGYLTGFLGGDSWLVIGPRGKPVLVSDARYAEDLEPFRELVRVRMRQGAMIDEVGALLADSGWARCGVQGEHLTLVQRAALAKVAGSKRLAPTSGLIGPLRAIKDEAELATLREAVRIQEAALEATLPTIRPEQTELEVCARLEFEMKVRGASGPSFGTIVGAGANSSRPHYRPGASRVARNHVLLIDWGALWRGYHGDMTRTFAMGRWPRELAKVYDVVLEAHDRAVAGLRAGALAREVDALARDHIARHGYGDRFGHGLGHGLGMHIHEGPSLSHRAGEAPLREGHVVTIEPGVYLPGVGGVRIEDDYVVTARGSRRLSTLPRDRAWATR